MRHPLLVISGLLMADVLLNKIRRASETFAAILVAGFQLDSGLKCIHRFVELLLHLMTGALACPGFDEL